MFERGCRTGRRTVSFSSPALALLLIGLAGTPVLADEAGPAEKKAVSKPAAAKLVPDISNVPKPTKRISAAKPGSGEETVPLDLEVSYMARLFVPAGSQLTVDAFDKDGKSVASTSVKTASSDATIPVKIDIAEDAGFPIRLDAKLKSEFGHLLTGSQTVEARTGDRVKLALKVIDASQ